MLTVPIQLAAKAVTLNVKSVGLTDCKVISKAVGNPDYSSNALIPITT